MSAPGTISIGSSTERHVVITMGDGRSTMHTMINPALARVYGAMLMTIADELDRSSPPLMKEEE